MGPVYERLGLSVGFVQERMSVAERQRAYAADVTYLTAKEAGFDHLRDGLALEPAERSQRAYHFALVDEADSILIDEARIPLVIAGETGEALAGPERLAVLVRDLVPGRDFDTDEHAHNIALTEAGTARVEAALGVDSLHAIEGVSLHAQLRHALHAEHLLRRDVDYIVRGGKVELVDESTGRVADKRHWPDGLHAAVEAKEGLRLSSEGRILGQVTLQHFLRLYPRLAGMTATAHTAAEELEAFYGLRTVVVPTHRPMVRADEPDVVFTHQEAKRAALVAEIARVHAAGRPVLVGTASVGESEDLAAALVAAGCPLPGAERAERRGGGRDRRAGGRARGGHHLDEHGRARHRHPPRRHGRGAPGRGGGHGRPLRDRHEPPRQPAHRPAAAGARRPAGRPRRRRASSSASRTRSSAATGSSSSSPPATCRPARTRRSRAGCFGPRSRAPSGSSRTRASSCGARSTATPRSSRSSGGPSSAGARRCWSRARSSTSSPTGRRSATQRLRPVVGQAILDEVERRLTLLAIDRCWSDHLAELREMREDSVLLAFAGRFPLAEFHHQAGESFQALEDRIEDEVVRDFERIEITPDGVDWEREGLRGPSATWTYLVGENPFGASGLLSPAGRIGSVAAAAGAPWLVLLQGLSVFWERRRRRKG